MSAYDLIVIGAGPAGCATAITAARAGASVLLLERGRFPRHKVCGEFVSAESLDLLATLLSPEHRNLISCATRIPEVRIFVDKAELPLAINPAAASIARFHLDAALWSSCAAHPIALRQDSPALAVEGEGPFAVKSSAEVFEAKALVNATGRWSNLTMAPQYRAQVRNRWIGIKAHFREPQPPASVDLYFFEGGYCGVQPVSANGNGSGAVNACAMVNSRFATTLSDVFALHPALLQRSRQWQQLTEPVSTSPLIFRDPQPIKRTMLQVGDSACFVDPFVGDGISLALRSGVLGAECLAAFFRGESSLHQSAVQYERRYNDSLSHVFRASSVLRRSLSWPKIARRPVLAILQKAPAFAQRFVAMTR